MFVVVVVVVVACCWCCCFVCVAVVFGGVKFSLLLMELLIAVDDFSISLSLTYLDLKNNQTNIE